METTLYYFGFEPEKLDGKRKKVFDYLKRALCPLGSAKLVLVEMSANDPKIYAFDHILIFPATELKSNPEVHSLRKEVAATSFCILAPGYNVIMTMVGL